MYVFYKKIFTVMNINLENVLFDYNSDKNNILLKERWVGFEDIIIYAKSWNVLDIIKNPSCNFDNQYCMIIKIKDYIYMVPFVRDKNLFFLKTIFPSRKFNKLYS